MSDSLTALEALATIRVLRSHRRLCIEKYEILQQRLRTHGNGLTAQAMHSLSNEIHILDEVIVKLWKHYLTKRREPP